MSEDLLDAAAQMRDPHTYAIIGAAMEVHREMGHGFLEAVYQQAMAIELGARSIPFIPQKPLVVRYKQVPLDCAYRADFLCFDQIIVEIKAISQITGVDRSQLINYLKATGLRVGLLINFGAASLQYERVVWG